MRTTAPGFRHVLEASLLLGGICGLADVSYIISRNPDTGAEFLQALRFYHAGSLVTFAAFSVLLALSLLILRPVAVVRRWPLQLSLAVLYFIGLVPAGAILCRNFALLVAAESHIVVRVKALYYFLKYLWLLLPVLWGIGSWLARVRVSTSAAVLAARFSAWALAALLFLVSVPVFQQRYLLEKANEYSEVVASGLETTVITLAAFAGALIVLAVAWPMAGLLATRGRGRGLAAAWVLFLAVPFMPPLMQGSSTSISPAAGGAVKGRQCNVILISLDTVRYDDTGPGGSTVTQTPVLDRLASEGIFYENAIAPMPLTGPSHISMFTGLQPDAETGHGVKTNGIPLADDVPTLATVLNEAGYRTGAVIGGFPLSRKACGLERGFNFYHDVFNDSVLARFLPDQMWYLTVSRIVRRVFDLAPLMPHGRTKPANRVTDQAIGWLEDNSDSPFFLFVHYYDAHYSYTPPPPFDTMYMPGYEGPYKGRAVEWNALMKEINRFTEEDFAYFRALYRGEVSFVDRELGRLVEWCEGRGLLQNTLFVIAADHGESFEHNYYFSHSDRVYDSVVRVPLIIREPDGEEAALRGIRVGDRLVNVSDIFFTVLRFLGVESPRSVHDMHNRVPGADPDWDHDLIGLAEEGGSGVGGWEFVPCQSYLFAGPAETDLGRFFCFRFIDSKLIYAPEAAPALPEMQYFDLTADPNELVDLFPETDWSKHPFPIAPDALRAWASLQGEMDEAVIDPQTRAQLRALGYVQ